MGNITNYRTLTFLDVETTHLDPEVGEIIQIAILTEDSNGNVKEWSTKIKPQLKLGTYSPKALEINGYNEVDWDDAPFFSDIAHLIVHKLQWGPVIAHNVNFDISFVENCLQRYSGWKKGGRTDFNEKIFRLGYPQIDTVALSYLFLPTERQNLNALREHFDISTEGAHEACKDVRDCRTVFWSIFGKTMDVIGS